MIKYDACPSCGCDGVRPYEPFHHVGWQKLDGRCRQCGKHPSEHEVEQLEKRVELLERALAMTAWHSITYRADDVPACTSCAASDTTQDNCPVMGVVERLDCPFPDDGDGIDPLAPVIEALSVPTYISRLTEDVPSYFKPGHVHVAGTEFAPIRREDGRMWEIEIRVPDGEGGYWYETMVVHLDKTEIVLEVRDVKP
jgi:hypothetical protein